MSFSSRSPFLFDRSSLSRVRLRSGPLDESSPSLLSPPLRSPRTTPRNHSSSTLRSSTSTRPFLPTRPFPSLPFPPFTSIHPSFFTSTSTSPPLPPHFTNFLPLPHHCSKPLISTTLPSSNETPRLNPIQKRTRILEKRRFRSASRRVGRGTERSSWEEVRWVVRLLVGGERGRRRWS